MSDAPNRPLMPDEAPDWFVAELAQAMYALGDHLHEWSEAGLDLRGGYLLEARLAVTAVMNLATEHERAASGGADQEDADLFAALVDAAVDEQEAIDARLVGGLVPSERERLNVRWQWLESVLDWIDELRVGAPSTDPAPEPGDARWATTKFDPTLILPKPWADDEIDPAKRGPWASIHCGTADLAATVVGLLNAANVEPAPEDGGA